jgi:hypothetical protein
MAVVSVTETKERTASIGDENKREYTRTFSVITDSPNTGPAIVRTAAGIPVRGDYYTTGTEFDLLAYALNIESSCISADGLQWIVNVDYGFIDNDGETNPLSEPSTESWSFQQFTRATDQDVNGNAIVNSAGDPFAQAVQVDDSRPVLSVTRNQATFNAPLAYLYKDKTNRDPFRGAPAGTVKVMDISGQQQHDQTFGTYWQVKVEVQFNIEGWDKVLLDQGFRELDGTSGELKPITNNGVVVSDPHLLDGVGAALPAGGTPQFGTYRVYGRMPFRILGIS